MNLPGDWIVRLTDTDTEDNTTTVLHAGDATSVQDEEGAYTFDVSDTECGSSIDSKSGGTSSANALVYDGSLTGNASAKSATGSRFELEITTEEALPVELNGFNGTVEQQDVLLEWETASETNNAGFYVQQKDAETNQFEDHTFVKSQAEGGTSTQSQSYQHRIENLDAGPHTFRLRQVDVDGNTTFSEALDSRSASRSRSR